ncbi:hypothetical protein ABKN59_000581 [Abortiporus biennis]
MYLGRVPLEDVFSIYYGFALRSGDRAFPHSPTKTLHHSMLVHPKQGQSAFNSVYMAHNDINQKRIMSLSSCTHYNQFGTALFMDQAKQSSLQSSQRSNPFQLRPAATMQDSSPSPSPSLAPHSPDRRSQSAASSTHSTSSRESSPSSEGSNSSHRRKRSRQGSVAHNASAEPPSISSYSSSIASYSWSRFAPYPTKDSNGEPILYVNYKDYSSRKLRISMELEEARKRKRASLPSLPEPSSSVGKPSSLSTTTRSSPAASDTSDIPSASGSTSVVSDSIPTQRNEHTSLEARARYEDRQSEFNDDFDQMHIRPSIESRSPQLHSSSSSKLRQSSVQTSLPPLRSLRKIDETNSDEWMIYARSIDIPGVGPQYTCTWTNRDEASTECGYTSKKHLVKRHVESKHLHIKPLACEICGKAFSQRSNYNTHLNTHTGAAPHICPYPNCGAAFGDPARRHRHMKSVHGHISSRRRTQGDITGIVQGYSVPNDEDDDDYSSVDVDPTRSPGLS